MRWDTRCRLTLGRLEGRTLVLERNSAAIDRAMELAGCYVVVTDVQAAEHMPSGAVCTYCYTGSMRKPR